MAVTRLGRSIVMTADDDAIAAGNYFFIAGMTFQGEGLTTGERLRVTDAGGSVLADYVIESDTVDNADLWNGRKPMFADGIKVEDGPGAGEGDGWALTIFLE